MKIECSKCHQKIDARLIVLKASKLKVWIGFCEKCKIHSLEVTKKTQVIILNNMVDEFCRQRKEFENSEKGSKIFVDLT